MTKFNSKLEGTTVEESVAKMSYEGKLFLQVEDKSGKLRRRDKLKLPEDSAEGLRL